jgi:hypothetical protein
MGETIEINYMGRTEKNVEDLSFQKIIDNNFKRLNNLFEVDNS